MPAVRQNKDKKRGPANNWIVFRDIYKNLPAVQERVKDFPPKEKLKEISIMASAKWRELSSEIKEGYRQMGIERYRRQVLEGDRKEKGLNTIRGRAFMEHSSRRSQNRQQPPQMPQTIPQDSQSQAPPNMGAAPSPAVASPPFVMAQWQPVQRRGPGPQQDLAWNQPQVFGRPPTYPPQNFAGRDYQRHVFPQAPINYYHHEQGAQMSAPDSQLQFTYYQHQAPVTPNEDWTPAPSSPAPQGDLRQAQDGQQFEQATWYHQSGSHGTPISAAPSYWTKNAIANVPHTMINTPSFDNYAACEFGAEAVAEHNFASQLPTHPEPNFSSNGYKGGNIYDNTVGGYNGQAHDYAGLDYFAAPTQAPIQLSREEWNQICEEEEEDEEVDSDPDLLIQAAEIVASALLSPEEAAPRFEEEENLAEGEDARVDYVEDMEEVDPPPRSQANSVHDQDGPLDDFGGIFPPSNEVSSFEFDIHTPPSPYQPPDPVYYQELRYQEWTSGEVFVYR